MRYQPIIRHTSKFSKLIAQTPLWGTRHAPRMTPPRSLQSPPHGPRFRALVKQMQRILQCLRQRREPLERIGIEKKKQGWRKMMARVCMILCVILNGGLQSRGDEAKAPHTNQRNGRIMAVANAMHHSHDQGYQEHGY